jgi:23S rRNA pseudouridine1911/1915/1917 synthase
VKICLTVEAMDKESNNIYYTNPVTEETKGIRIDKFIASEISEISRSMAQKLIEKGCVFADEENIADKDFKTRVNDVYQITMPDLESPIPVAQDIKLDVLYEDDDLIVVNKPAGMTVHPAAGVTRDTLVNALLFWCKDSLSGVGGVARPGIVHRIDRNTSGVLVVAKNDFAHKDLAEQFFNHSIERTYYAIVYGIPTPQSGVIEGNIARSPYDRKKMALVKNGGKTAITHYSVVENYKNVASLVKCNLETGRTHQIRVHLSSIGCHLVGDDVYEKPKKSNVLLPNDIKKYVNSFPRQALHAYSLGFIHPRTKEFLSFCADFPSDLKELVETLKK